MPEPDRITWRATRERLKLDRERLVAMIKRDDPHAPPFVLFYPPWLCVFLHRLSHYLYRRGWRWMARVLWHLNVLLTGADISPPADLGGGLVILQPAGIAVMGVAGRNLTVMALSGLGGELGRREDVGAGPGVPVLGDDVTLEPHTAVLGPVRIGNRVRVEAGAVVTRDVEDDGVVSGVAPMIKKAAAP
jgi:serine O-acetyltransferase